MSVRVWGGSEVHRRFSRSLSPALSEPAPAGAPWASRSPPAGRGLLCRGPGPCGVRRGGRDSEGTREVSRSHLGVEQRPHLARKTGSAAGRGAADTRGGSVRAPRPAHAILAETGWGERPVPYSSAAWGHTRAEVWPALKVCFLCGATGRCPVPTPARLLAMTDEFNMLSHLTNPATLASRHLAGGQRGLGRSSVQAACGQGERHEISSHFQTDVYDSGPHQRKPNPSKSRRALKFSKT